MLFVAGLLTPSVTGVLGRVPNIWASQQSSASMTVKDFNIAASSTPDSIRSSLYAKKSVCILIHFECNCWRIRWLIHSINGISAVRSDQVFHSANQIVRGIVTNSQSVFSRGCVDRCVCCLGCQPKATFTSCFSIRYRNWRVHASSLNDVCSIVPVTALTWQPKFLAKKRPRHVRYDTSFACASSTGIFET
jgi:hypothetical protein